MHELLRALCTRVDLHRANKPCFCYVEAWSYVEDVLGHFAKRSSCLADETFAEYINSDTIVNLNTDATVTISISIRMPLVFVFHPTATKSRRIEQRPPKPINISKSV